MAKGIRQIAANLAAALESGSAQDSRSAMADWKDYVDTHEGVPEADNGPIQRPLSPEDVESD